jgi:hypothetical protein
MASDIKTPITNTRLKPEKMLSTRRLQHADLLSGKARNSAGIHGKLRRWELRYSRNVFSSIRFTPLLVPALHLPHAEAPPNLIITF